MEGDERGAGTEWFQQGTNGLAARVACNTIAHTYNDAAALDIIHETQERYLPMLETLKLNLYEK